MSNAHALHRETEAARSLLLNLRDILAGDEQATADAIEGETNLIETIGSALVRLGEIDAHRDAIETMAGSLKARAERLKKQGELIRTALVPAIEATGRKSIETPAATVTLKAVPPAVAIVSEADIPSEFWKPQDPKLDKRAVLAALKDKRPVPGAQLDNGSMTISVRFG